MYVPRGSIDRVAASHSAVEVDGVSEAGSDEAEEDVEVRAREPVRVAELAVGHVLDDDLLPIDVLVAPVRGSCVGVGEGGGAPGDDRGDDGGGLRSRGTRDAAPGRCATRRT